MEAAYGIEKNLALEASLLGSNPDKCVILGKVFNFFCLGLLMSKMITTLEGLGDSRV